MRILFLIGMALCGNVLAETENRDAALPDRRLSVPSCLEEAVCEKGGQRAV